MVRSPVRVPPNPDVPTPQTSPEPLRKPKFSVARLSQEIYGPFRKSVSTREQPDTITIPKYSSWLRKSQPKPFTPRRPQLRSRSLKLQASPNRKNVDETSQDFQLLLTKLNESQPQDPFETVEKYISTTNDIKTPNLNIKIPNAHTIGTFSKKIPENDSEKLFSLTTHTKFRKFHIPNSLIRNNSKRNIFDEKFSTKRNQISDKIFGRSQEPSHVILPKKQDLFKNKFGLESHRLMDKMWDTKNRFYEADLQNYSNLSFRNSTDSFKFRDSIKKKVSKKVTNLDVGAIDTENPLVAATGNDGQAAFAKFSITTMDGFQLDPDGKKNARGTHPAANRYSEHYLYRKLDSYQQSRTDDPRTPSKYFTAYPMLTSPKPDTVDNTEKSNLVNFQNEA